MRTDFLLDPAHPPLQDRLRDEESQHLPFDDQVLPDPGVRPDGRPHRQHLRMRGDGARPRHLRGDGQGVRAGWLQVHQGHPPQKRKEKDQSQEYRVRQLQTLQEQQLPAESGPGDRDQGDTPGEGEEDRGEGK